MRLASGLLGCHVIDGAHHLPGLGQLLLAAAAVGHAGQAEVEDLDGTAAVDQQVHGTPLDYETLTGKEVEALLKGEPIVRPEQDDTPLMVFDEIDSNVGGVWFGDIEGTESLDAFEAPEEVYQ